MTIKDAAAQLDPDYWANLEEQLQHGALEEDLVDMGYNMVPNPHQTAEEAVGVVASTEVELTPEYEFMDEFSWVPQRRAEVTLAITGLPETLRRSCLGGGIPAAEEVLGRARSYERQASMQHGILRHALVDSTDPSSPLDIRRVRTDPDIQQVLAIFQISSRALVDQKWPGRYNGPTMQKRMREIMQRIANGSDGDLIDWCMEASNSTAARQQHWQAELAKIADDPIVYRIDREASDQSRRR